MSLSPSLGAAVSGEPGSADTTTTTSAAAAPIPPVATTTPAAGEGQEVLGPTVVTPSQEAEDGDGEKAAQEPASQATQGGQLEDQQEGPTSTTTSITPLPSSSKAGPAKPRPKPAPTTAARIRNLLGALVKHPAAWPFLAPVREEDVPGYHATITNPMDLATIKARVPHYLSAPGAAASGGPNKPISKHKAAALNAAKTLSSFRADMDLMFSNCFTFNAPGDVVYEAGRLLQSHFNTLLVTHQLDGKKRGPAANRSDGEGAGDSEGEHSDVGMSSSKASKGKGSSTKRKAKASGVNDVDEALDAIAAAIANAQRQLEELRSTNAAANPAAFATATTTSSRSALARAASSAPSYDYAEAYEEESYELDVVRTPPRKRERMMEQLAPHVASPGMAGSHQPQSLSSLVRRKPGAKASAPSYMKADTSTGRPVGRPRVNRAPKPPVVVPTVCPDCNLAIVKKKCPKCRRKFIKTQYIRKPPITYAQKRELAASISDPNFPPAALKKIIKMISDSLPPTSGREGGAVELNLDILHPRTLRSLFELVNRVNGKSPEGYPLDAAGNPIVPAGGHGAGTSSTTSYSQQEGTSVATSGGGDGDGGDEDAGDSELDGEEGNGHLLDMVEGGGEDHSSLASMDIQQQQQHHLYQHPSMAGVGTSAATSFYNHHQDMAAAAAAHHSMPYHPY